MNENATVLVADDDEHLLKVVAHALQNAGYTCTTVLDGEAAINALRKKSYTVALIDLDMPKLNGFEVLSELQRNGLEVVPVLLTGSGDIGKAVRAMKLGAYEFVEKPVNPTILNAVVERAVKHWRLCDANKALETAALEHQAELAKANMNLRSALEEQSRISALLRLEEERLEALWTLSQMGDKSIQEITHFAMEEGVRLTRSTLGYLAFMNADESVLTMHAWSKTAMELCAVIDKPIIYPVENTGLWGEAVRQRRPVITNDYAAPNPLKKGTPTGHVPVVRHMNIPVFDEGRITVVAGVGNKEGDYDESDVRQLSLLMDGMWRIIRQKKAAEALKIAHLSLECKVAQRTQELAELNENLKGEVLERTIAEQELRQMEEALRTSEEKMRQMLDNVGIGVALLSPDLRLIELNAKMRQWFPHIQLESNPFCYCAYIRPPHDAPCPSCPVMMTLMDGGTHEIVAERMLPAGPRNLRIVSCPIHDVDGRVVAVVEMVEDITDRVRMEHELGQAQKLEAVGRLAAGIAHEINTPTQYVGDNIEFLQIAHESLSSITLMLRRIVATGSEDDALLALIAEAGELITNINLDYLTEQIPRAIEQSLEGIGRIASIVQAMKEFSHPGSSEKSSVDLNQGIVSTVTVSRNEWKYVAELETELDPGLPQVVCLPGELNQVFLNLIVNAAHAIGDVVGKDSEQKGKIRISTHRDGDWVEIRFGDTGAGIPEDIRSRIFDPFFTTKAVGRGTGQGLAIARSVVVDKHGGTITVESEVGKGTTFIVRLPIGV